MVLAALIGIVALVAAPPAGLANEVIDKGSFKIFHGDRPAGAETFEISQTADSLFVQCNQYLTISTSRGDQPLEKGVDVLVGRQDYGLRLYQSRRTFQGATTTRALVTADTHYVAYREAGDRGDGEARILPPGLLFVMDAQVITLFDLLCRTLQHAGFASRSINLLALGPRDTMLDARAVVLGTETIRWGNKPVVARKLQVIADSQITLTLWVGQQGQLLRLVEPKGGLRAEREPPPTRKRTPAPKPGESKPGG